MQIKSILSSSQHTFDSVVNDLFSKGWRLYTVPVFSNDKFACVMFISDEQRGRLDSVPTEQGKEDQK